MTCVDPMRAPSGAFSHPDWGPCAGAGGQGGYSTMGDQGLIRTQLPMGYPQNLEAPPPTVYPQGVGAPPTTGYSQGMEAPPHQQQQQQGRWHQAVELHGQGWFHAESNREEQEMLAASHMDALHRAVDERHMRGQCADARWVNDPEVFPDLGLAGSMTSNGVIPFPPHDQQFYVRGVFQRSKSKLRETAIPSHEVDEEGNSSWVRLVDFADHADACHLFDESRPQVHHFGRVRQGALDNGYLVEALQAISLRPKVARQLFYHWDVRRSIYIARIFKHGTWMRVEVDDFVPVGAPSKDGSDGHVPICCRSEFFPHVLWPSLVEKAYAKVHTIRASPTEVTEEDTGGWEAISGGGRVEEALADLTGGVAGRFQTCDVSEERLFLYIYELQQDTLFACRPHQFNCEIHGVRLNPYYPYAVNRAAVYEGRPYIQVFSGSPGVFDGGLQDIDVPYGLLHCKDYPETTSEGFFWISASDFHEYFDVIFECRLVNSGDVSIPGMPPPRLPPRMPPAGGPGADRAWYEWVFATPGEVSADNAPEFSVAVPPGHAPCDIIASVEQLDSRMLARSPIHEDPAALLVKVYEHIEGRRYYSSDLVCKSNWLPLRDSMVAFTVLRGGEFKLVVEFPDLFAKVDRMVFRCYSSAPGCTVTAAAATHRHLLTSPLEDAKAQRLSLVGCVQAERLDRPDAPQGLDEEHDCLRKPEFDLAPGWEDLKSEFQQDCVLM